MRILPWIMLVFVLCAPSLSYGYSSKGQDCGKCHTLSRGEAEKLLKEISKDNQIRIDEIEMAPSRIFWEVLFEVGGKKGIIYVDMSKKYAFLGKLIDIRERKDLTQERLAESRKVDVSLIPLKDALILGDRAASKRVVVFSDPDCPFCARLHGELKKVVQQRRDIAFYIKMNPLAVHKGAYEKAKAIMCARSLALLDDAFSNKPLGKSTCETTVVDESMRLAKALGISSAPALVMPDGRLISGFIDAKSLIGAVDRK